jgi:hypothetical protein
VQQALAALRQGQLARAALEQAQPQAGFEPRDVLAHRGGRQAQLPRGGGEAAGVGAADE